jgi:hypothetical protein
MIFGWASGTFGMFDLRKEDIAHPELNFAGVALSLVGLLLFLQVQSKVSHRFRGIFLLTYVDSAM